jgi:hypothetical protein
MRIKLIPFSLILTILLIMVSFAPEAYTQDSTDHTAWSWIRVDGELDDFSSQ